jgi:hypothetical protein
MDLLVRPQEKNNFRPPVKSRMFAQEGSQRPRRLVDYASLIAFLHSLPSGSDVSTIIPRGKHLPKEEPNVPRGMHKKTATKP